MPALVSDAYAIVPDAQSLTAVMTVVQKLRAAGVSVQMHSPTTAGEGMGSMKSQFKKADGSGARFALIFGADELARGAVTVKSLRDGEGQQTEQSLDAIDSWAATLQISGEANT